MRPNLFVSCFTLAALLAFGTRAQGAEAEAPAVHAAVPAQAGGHGAPGAAPASCEQILSAPAETHGGAMPAVSEVIFHHVSDSYTVAFESPFSHSSIGFDFKRLECRLLGWNGVIPVAGFNLDLTPTKHAFWMWVAAALLIAAFVVAGPKKGQLIPSGTGTVLEMLVLFVRDEIARKTIPGQASADRYTPYLLTAFFFILTMNLLGLIPFGGTATANLGVTVGLALLTFFITQAAGIRAAGFGGWLKHLTGGVHPLLWPIMIPVEVLGLFTKPFALTVRLFANMVAGHVVIFFLIGLIFILKSALVAAVSVPFAFAVYLLEIFVAFVQAYVFTMLSSLFIGFGVAMGHHGTHEEPAGECEAQDEEAAHH